MIPRTLEPTLRQVAQQYPVVTVTGPRQSGKTTLCRHVFGHLPYRSLEALDTREYARDDPRGFLNELRDGAILDEVQHVPELLSYLQGEVDARPAPGRFVLTGSQHFGLSAAISQSLAGRTAVLRLLPLSWSELSRAPDAAARVAGTQPAHGPASLMRALWTGGYPAIYDRGVPPDRWLGDYVTTYVQRDVRQVLAVSDLNAFTTFVRLAAGRTGGVLNLSSLGGDVGVNHNTVKAWISVLETGFLAHRLPAWHRTLRKQLTKAPKLHFFDSGLACYLLGIRSPDQLLHHPLRGAIFESWVVSEVLKARWHRGRPADMWYLRDHRGFEVDLVLDRGDALVLAELKSGATLSRDMFAPVARLAQQVRAHGEQRPVVPAVVYGGTERQRRSAGLAVPWTEVEPLVTDPTLAPALGPTSGAAPR